MTDPTSDPVEMQKETLTIEGDRKLFRYTFRLPEDAPEAKPAETAEPEPTEAHG